MVNDTFDQNKVTSIAIGTTSVSTLIAAWRFRKSPGVWTALPVAAGLLALTELVHRRITHE